MRRKFSWEYFDTDFIRSIVYSNRTSKKLRPAREYDDKLLMLPTMDRICPKPDDHFVRHYRKEITEHFLAGSPHLVSIMKELEKRRYGSVRLDSMEHMLEQFNQLRLTSTVLTLIIHELRQVGYRMPETDTDLSIFTSPKKLDLKACMNFLPFEVQENGSDTFKEALLGSFETKSKQGRANETRIERILGYSLIAILRLLGVENSLI